MFINEFEMFLLNSSDFKGKLILTGNFNINYFQKDNTLASFNNILSNYNLQQLVTKSTTIHNSVLDLIIIEDTLMKTLLSITVQQNDTTHIKSDHYVILLALYARLPPKKLVISSINIQ